MVRNVRGAGGCFVRVSDAMATSGGTAPSRGATTPATPSPSRGHGRPAMHLRTISHRLEGHNVVTETSPRTGPEPCGCGMQVGAGSAPARSLAARERFYDPETKTVSCLDCDASPTGASEPEVTIPGPAARG